MPVGLEEDLSVCNVEFTLERDQEIFCVHVYTEWKIEKEQTKGRSGGHQIRSGEAEVNTV